MSDLVQVPWLAIRPVGNVTHSVQLQLEKSRPPDSLLDVPCSGFPTSVMGETRRRPREAPGHLLNLPPFLLLSPVLPACLGTFLGPDPQAPPPVCLGSHVARHDSFREHQGLPIRQDSPSSARVKPAVALVLRPAAGAGSVDTWPTPAEPGWGLLDQSCVHAPLLSPLCL